MVKWTTGGLSTVTSDTDMAVVATFDLARYLFNCPENTTRASIQHRRGFRKMAAVFLTRVHTDSATGLPGYLMSHADAKNPKITLVGPQGLGAFLASTRTYATRCARRVRCRLLSTLEMTVTEVAEASSEPCYKDSNLTVYAVPIHPSYSELDSHSSTKRKREDDDGLADGPTKAPRLDNAPFDRHPPKRRNDAGPWKQLVTTLGFTTTPPGMQAQRSVPRWGPAQPRAVSYICVGPSFRGKFDAARANELGVMGRDRSRLTRGESVVTANGTVVTPDMCIAPSLPPATFMVVDCPSPAYIDGLISAPQFAKHRARGELPVHNIYYRLGEGVLQDERFRTWMNTFGPDVHHIISGSGHTPDPVTFTSSASILLQLNYLDPEIFPLPQYSLQAAESLTDLVGMPDSAHLLDPYHQVLMHPPQSPETIPRSEDDRFHPQHALGAEAYLDEDTTSAFDAAREAAKPLRDVSSAPAPGDDVRVTTLGTGSAAPSMYRNVLCNLIEIPGAGNVILDCGEGSYGQLVRKFGRARLPAVLRETRALFVSHNHADHHMGVARVLSHRRKLAPGAPPLYLVAMRYTHEYLREYQQIEDLGLGASVVPIYNEDIRIDEWPGKTAAINRPAQPHEAHVKELLKALRLKSFSTVFVMHRCAAYGMRMAHEDGWSIVFSGDTMPCDNLVKAGQGATLLIHEASMADDQLETAQSKGHSTFGDALDVAKRMKVQNVLLTHFSSRYPKLVRGSKDTGAGGPVVGVAFDGLTVPIGAMRRLNSYLPVLESHFADRLEEEDLTAPGGDGAHILVE
ncbi:hypothetical protein AURDEDRAFT_51696 [Auricularia subglabra TFB-10046 SS5]|nr:hypothetical protein AURDEDRAFT_51696 [Auricularia subglabra TFB-10046 SS5]